MSQRKINLYSTSGKVTNGSLEGVSNMQELREKLKDLKIDLTNKTLIDGKTETEYSLSSTTELPEGDLQLYILPSKTKSGFLSN